jgi:hypothetical protein
MTSEFREPLIWAALAVVAHGIVQIVAFVFLDQDLTRHLQAKSSAGQELSLIYGRLGQHWAQEEELVTAVEKFS